MALGNRLLFNYIETMLAFVALGTYFIGVLDRDIGSRGLIPESNGCVVGIADWDVANIALDIVPFIL
ncbi:MAG: hypothetical protein C4586_07120 [Anaerolineaceae bacterium]|nr:MAG: hypothetical protein C4586_07120 [Anaerolineaceae bacterium]